MRACARVYNTLYNWRAPSFRPPPSRAHGLHPTILTDEFFHFLVSLRRQGTPWLVLLMLLMLWLWLHVHQLGMIPLR